ncbi:MAG: flagellar hook-associated protein 3, partial [Lachnospiraceae bacterium]|nr:flagellar hook-associated protein 3 [Lachnospiraceae bacterium]
MRMTNKIMRNNAAYNINQNKILQDKLTNQMTNQSKIVRPSDDPVVAIRALRLRSNVAAVTQYNEKNAKDAEQWLSLTADAMDTVDQVLNDLYKQATSAPNKFENAEDLRIYLTQMKQLTAEFYSCANVDYAGRFVFSGYRTDLPVTFTEEDMKQMEEHPVSFNIDEDFGFKDISRI